MSINIQGFADRVAIIEHGHAGRVDDDVRTAVRRENLRLQFGDGQALLTGERAARQAAGWPSSRKLMPIALTAGLLSALAGSVREGG